MSDISGATFRRRILDEQSVLEQATRATTWLFPDGAEAIGAVHFAINWFKVRETPGSNLTRIVKAFMDGDNEPFRREFVTVSGLLSDVSGKNLRWLDQFLFTYSYQDLTYGWSSERHGIVLSPDQMGIVQTESIVPPEHRSRLPAGGI